MSPIPHVVIVGGGFGGLTVARSLRARDARVTLIDKRNHHLFQPLLYQVATAGLAPSDIAEPLRGILAGKAHVEVMLGEVTDVDVDAKQVQLADRTVAYDVLVVAAGVGKTWFGHDVWAQHAPGLKTLGDALEIRRRLLTAFEQAEWTDDDAERQKLCTFVVVGGGPTGVEMAGAIREIAAQTLSHDFRRIDPTTTRVVLVEAGPAVLGHFPEPLGAKARAHLEQLGVEVRTGVSVSAIDADGVVLDGERVPAATVVWAAGVKASPLAACLGVPTDRGGRVIVDAHLAIPGHPEVFVIGDLAHSDGGDGPLPGLAPVAIQMGQHVTRTIRDDARSRPRRPFRYRDFGTMATVGKSLAVAAVGPLRFGGFPAWLAWVFVHLMTLVGHRSRVVVFVKWAWAWFTNDRSSRLLWRDERERETEAEEAAA